MSTNSTHGSRVFSMASGTLASRLTGLLRVLVLAWVLGFTPIADAFNLANTVPNMLFDLVLGGVASATFIPVFVERLALDGERRAWKSISSVVTGALLVLVVASLVAWFCAPWIIDGFTVAAPRDHGPIPEHPGRAARARHAAAALVRAPDLLLRHHRHRHRAAQHPQSLRHRIVGARRQQHRLHRSARLVPPRRSHAHARTH